MKPNLIILCGKIGAGKTTFARKLEAQGIERLSIDEKVFEKLEAFRNPDDNYRVDESMLRDTEKEVFAENLKLAAKFIREGRSVVFEYGFWRKSARDQYRKFAVEFGAEFILYFLDIELGEQIRRIELRNQGDLTGTHFISRQDIEYFNGIFEPPEGENEIAIKS